MEGNHNFSQLNPLGIDLVLDLLFGYLEPRHLRRCRLVSHQWNSLIAKKGKAAPHPECTVPLNSTNILEYSAMVRRSTLPPQALFPVSLNMQARRDEDGSALDKFIVNELVDRLGQQFVHSLTCTSAKSVQDWQNVFEIVQLLSPGLKTLWISEGPFKDSISQLQLRAEDLYLPALTSITYFEILKNPMLLADLVNSTSNLRKLKIVINSMETIKGESYRNRSVAISKVLSHLDPSKLQHLQRLVVPLDEESTYSALDKIQFPALQQLKLSLKRNACDASARILSRFLSSNCPKLTSLEFSFLICKRELGYPLLGFPNGHEFAEFPKFLPHLPNLTHFGYAYDEFPSAAAIPSFIRADHLNSTCFPNLDSVTVAYGTFLFSAASFEDPEFEWELDSIDWYNNHVLLRISFPSVTHLKFVLNASVRFGIMMKMPRLELREACNQLHLLFPNVDDLYLDMQIVPLASKICDDRASEFLSNLLEEVTPIKKLQLANYYHSRRQFAQFLKDNPLTVTALQSLEEITFLHDSMSIGGKRTATCLPIGPIQKKGPAVHWSDCFLPQNLNSLNYTGRQEVLDTFGYITESLPHLKLLKVDGRCLKDNCSHDLRPEAIVEKLQAIFSKLNIQIC